MRDLYVSISQRETRDGEGLTFCSFFYGRFSRMPRLKRFVRLKMRTEIRQILHE